MFMARADKKTNIDKVTASLVKNPNQTEEQIAKDTWLWQSTVNRAKQEVGKTGYKDDRIINLTDGDFDLMETIQKIKKDRLTNDKEVNNTDINNWDRQAQARYTLFRWDATDNKGWLKNSVKEKTTEELLKELENSDN